MLISVGDSGIFDPINLTIRVCSYPANRVTLKFQVLTYLAKTKATLAWINPLTNFKINSLNDWH